MTSQHVAAPAHAPRVPHTDSCAALGLVALVALIALLDAFVGVGVVGWGVGLACGVALTGYLRQGLAAAGSTSPGPADLVTYARGLLACGVAALTAAGLTGAPHTVAVLLLAAPGLALDAVDGTVARRTGTTSAFGGRFDGEVDAFLILVLSALVAPTFGWWILAAGVARYAFGAAGLVLPWMRGRLEFRYWRKVVAATMGITLLVAASGIVPRGAMTLGLAGALALLAESFGRDVWSLWRASGRGRRRVIPGVGTVLALGVTWFALTAPTHPDRLSLSAFLRVPLEAGILAVLVLTLPPRGARALGVGAGVLVGMIAMLKTLDLGAHTVLGRPFEVVTDGPLLTSGLSFVGDAAGPWAERGVALGAIALVVTLLLALPWATLRMVGRVRRHRRRALQVCAGLIAAWLALAVAGVRSPNGDPVAVLGAGPFAVDTIGASLEARCQVAQFEQTLAVDPLSAAPQDLSALAGTDVLVVFVESYGRVAVDGPASGPVRRLLRDRGASLRAAGLTSASGYLMSSTFGGSSWLAHSTLQAGVPVTDQLRYDALLSSRRGTVSSILAQSGWRSVALLPAVDAPWPEGQRFYGFDRTYTAADLGYRGPAFGFSRVPDQFALTAFGRRELGPGRRVPIVAQIELTSSHVPWAPLPVLVAPRRLGDGSVYTEIEAKAAGPGAVLGSPAALASAYRTSIGYALTSLLDFIAGHAHDHLVVIMLGDHQPATTVSGDSGNRDVPVSVIASDPTLVKRVIGWGWTPGLVPARDAPVAPMAGFRDRFLSLGSAP